MWGKVLGAFFGYMMAGPAGLILGLIVGHLFDRSQTINLSSRVNMTQRTFFMATFQIMGHLAKADGRVSEAEIQAARNIMAQMRLQEQQRREAIAFFQMGKAADFDLNATLNKLATSCGHHRVLLRIFIEIQIQASAADGRLHPAVHEHLQQICQRLGFSLSDFIVLEQRQRSEQQYRRYHQYSQGDYSTQRTDYLKEAYKLLEIDSNVNDSEVKKAYRRQMSQHHPDKLASKGLPEAMIKIATQKTQEIKKAYEDIMAARKRTVH